MGLTTGLLDRRTSVENPLLPLTSTALLDVLGGAPTHSGTSVNHKTAVKFIAVYRSVSIVAGVIAALPLQAKSGYEVVEVDFLQDPHVDMTPFELWEKVLWALLLSGNSYSAKLHRRDKTIAGLDPYEVGHVTPRRVAKTARNPWGKEFDVRTVDWPKVLTPEDVLHIPGPGYDGVEGLSPVGVARQGIGLGLAAEEFGARHFGSGSLIRGILQTDAKIDQDTADALQDRWASKTRGMGNAHKIPVLDAGAKFQPIGMSPADSQFIETRLHQVGEVSRLYGIPLHLLAETTKSTSWGTGIEQQNIGLILFTLAAWMTRLEQRVAKECISKKLTVDFDTAELLRGDLKSQMEAAGIAVEKGIRVANEVRKGLRLPPIDGGDLRTIPANWSILGADGLPVHVGNGSAQPTDTNPPAPTGAGDGPDDGSLDGAAQ